MKNEEKVEIKQEKGTEKEVYEKPECKSYQPLKIMRKWTDKSSELEF